MNLLKGIIKKKPKAPWKKYYTKEEMKIKAPDISIYEMLKESAGKYKSNAAINYFGKKMSYTELLYQIDRCTLAFRSQGIKQGDVVTICMPNTPEAVISFYAVNKIGAIANMIHPLSGEVEIKKYLLTTNSVMLVMIDICYEKIENIIKDTEVYKTIVVSAKDSMPFFLGVGYAFTNGFKIKRPEKSEEYIYWKDFIRKADKYSKEYKVKIGKETPAVILHSGGSTGIPKGIVLSNGNFNVLALQIRTLFKKIKPQDKILSIMPVFHGFGLGVSIHAPLFLGMEVILVPQFNPKKFDKLLSKYQPAAVPGVPTLYETLINIKNSNLNLSCLKYVVCGGDILTNTLAGKINAYLKEHSAPAQIKVGYGLTEALAGVAFSVDEAEKEGSIGIPLPGNYFKIVKPETQEEVNFMEDGEICICGPTVMMGYLNNEKETNEVLQIHKDGFIWLHTGDIGCMDEDGVIFYKQRLKRMIITSGYNVYPSHLEQVIEEHPAVLKCSVVGIPHPYKVEVAKAYIVLKNENSSLMVKHSIKEHCKKNLAKYAVPHEYEFRKSLPKTLIGKIDFKKLQDENIIKEKN